MAYRKVNRPSPALAEKLGRLGTQPDEICAYLDRLTHLVACGELDCRVAEALTKAANSALRAARDHDDKTEELRLRKMLAEARAIHNAGIRRENADRLHVEDEDAEIIGDDDD